MITVFGATGYTGRLVASELAQAGRALRLAGRSAERLALLAGELAVQTDTVVADAADPASLAALLPETRVLVNCAGPFTDIGEPVAALAARRGLRYLDTTNELGFVHSLYTRLDALARVSGATLVPACAFEVALADCAAALLGRGLSALDEVRVVYQLPGMGSSYGTRASAVRSLATSWLAYRSGRYVAAQPGAGGCGRVCFPGGRAYPTLAFPSSETATIPAHLAVRDVVTCMTVSRLGGAVGPWLIPLAGVLLRGPVGALLRALARRAAPPPSPDQRVQMPFAILVQVRAGALERCLVLRGRDPYLLTAQIVAHAAVRLADGEPPAGVIPPARALDPDEFLAAVRAWGVTVE